MIKTKNRLSTTERNEILKKIVDFARTKSIEGYDYPYAFGYISVVLTDEQLLDLERGLE